MISENISRRDAIKYGALSAAALLVPVSFTELFTPQEAQAAKVRRFDVYFQANGGTGRMSRRSWKQGSRYKLPACSFKRKKYKFTGWKNTRTGKVYKAGTKVTAGMKLASSVDNYPIYFKAQWKRK